MHSFITLYHNYKRLLAQLWQSRAKKAFRKESKWMAKADLVILDDFGLTKLESAVGLSFLEILENRWRM
ncbi:MAG: ATP-binding protein [Spirochaetes bacterium]|nr:ATP-binding protein [Spirochaetota bacterium]